MCFQMTAMLGSGCLFPQEFWEYYIPFGVTPEDGNHCDPINDHPYPEVELFSTQAFYCLQGCQAAFLQGLTTGTGWKKGVDYIYALGARDRLHVLFRFCTYFFASCRTKSFLNKY
mgnify:CR=1 FL=1